MWRRVQRTTPSPLCADADASRRIYSAPGRFRELALGAHGYLRKALRRRGVASLAEVLATQGKPKARHLQGGPHSARPVLSSDEFALVEALLHE